MKKLPCSKRSFETSRTNSLPRMPLVIPNLEVRRIFLEATDLWFRDFALKIERTSFFEAFWSGEAYALTREISRFLARSISYFDTHYDYCHSFICGIFFKSGYEVQSNDELGDGRTDIVVDDANFMVAVLEIKQTKDKSAFGTPPAQALTQIEERHFDAKFRENPLMTILHWGLAFSGKNCRAACVRIDPEAPLG